MSGYNVGNNALKSRQRVSHFRVTFRFGFRMFRIVQVSVTEGKLGSPQFDFLDLRVGWLEQDFRRSGASVRFRHGSDDKLLGLILARAQNGVDLLLNCFLANIVSVGVVAQHALSKMIEKSGNSFCEIVQTSTNRI